MTTGETDVPYPHPADALAAAAAAAAVADKTCNGGSSGIELTEMEASSSTTTAAAAELLEVKPLVEHQDESETESNGSSSHHHGLLPGGGTASNAQVAVNTIISFVGAGLLAVSNVFAKSGWLLGSVLLCIVSALNVYSMLLLPQVRNHLVKEGKEQACNDYGALGRVILGRKGEVFVNICLVVSQIGFATAYIIFIAANLNDIYAISRLIVCMACIPGLALLVQAREMKYLAPFSLLADVANLVGLSAVLFEDWESYEPHNDTIHKVKWEGFLNVIAITVYSMEGVGLILSLENSCRDKLQFPSLFKTVLTCITLFMALFGSAGYWAFGDNTKAPITLNLEGSSGVATFVKLSLCVALYLTYPVMMFPVWTIAQEQFGLGDENRIQTVGFRTSLVVLSAAIAYAVPGFDKFLQLVGSSICTVLGFILPCYFHIATFQKHLPRWQYLLDVFLIGGGALFGMVGTYQSFVHLFDEDSEKH